MDFKFYISLMGINPTIILKEKPEVIVDLLILSGDISDISFLWNNLQEFNNFLSDNLFTIDPALLNPAVEVTNAYEKCLEDIRDLVKFKTGLDLDMIKSEEEISFYNLFLKRKQRISGTKIEGMSSSTLSMIYKMDLDTLEAILNQVNFIVTTYSYSEDKNKQKVMKDYLDRNYSYSKQEIMVLDALQFPPIWNNEKVLKSKLITNLSVSNDSVRNYNLIKRNNDLVDKIKSLAFIRKNKIVIQV